MKYVLTGNVEAIDQLGITTQLEKVSSVTCFLKENSRDGIVIFFHGDIEEAKQCQQQWAQAYNENNSKEPTFKGIDRFHGVVVLSGSNNQNGSSFKDEEINDFAKEKIFFMRQGRTHKDIPTRIKGFIVDCNRNNKPNFNLLHPASGTKPTIEGTLKSIQHDLEKISPSVKDADKKAIALYSGNYPKDKKLGRLNELLNSMLPEASKEALLLLLITELLNEFKKPNPNDGSIKLNVLVIDDEFTEEKVKGSNFKGLINTDVNVTYHTPEDNGDATLEICVEKIKSVSILGESFCALIILDIQFGGDEGNIKEFAGFKILEKLNNRNINHSPILIWSTLAQSFPSLPLLGLTRIYSFQKSALTEENSLERMLFRRGLCPDLVSDEDAKQMQPYQNHQPKRKSAKKIITTQIEHLKNLHFAREAVWFNRVTGIMGETGSGKTLLAEYMADWSRYPCSEQNIIYAAEQTTEETLQELDKYTTGRLSGFLLIEDIPLKDVPTIKSYTPLMIDPRVIRRMNKLDKMPNVLCVFTSKEKFKPTVPIIIDIPPITNNNDEGEYSTAIFKWHFNDFMSKNEREKTPDRQLEDDIQGFFNGVKGKILDGHQISILAETLADEANLLKINNAMLESHYSHSS